MPPIDPRKFDHPLQLGGIRTGSIDYPEAAGNPSTGCRTAFVDTGSGLRFTVALDRGGDLVEATYAQHNLAYLTPNGYKPPNFAYRREDRWLDGWAGGLLTTCGPQHIGAPREENGQTITLHGHHSNTPASLELLQNPDPAFGQTQMVLEMLVRDSRMFHPVLETRRRIQCRLGEPVIHLHDTVLNRSDRRVPHNLLYHVNFGYPLLDQGVKLVYRGLARLTNPPAEPVRETALNEHKTVPDSVPWHIGTDQQVILIEPEPQPDGLMRIGLVNLELNLGVELCYPHEQLPRLANWQHFGPTGCYVTGIEPYYGSLLGPAEDPEPNRVDTWLEPGESRRYEISLRVLDGAAACEELLALDGKLTPAP